MTGLSASSSLLNGAQRLRAIIYTCPRIVCDIVVWAAYGSPDRLLSLDIVSLMTVCGDPDRHLVCSLPSLLGVYRVNTPCLTHLSLAGGTEAVSLLQTVSILLMPPGVHTRVWNFWPVIPRAVNCTGDFQVAPRNAGSTSPQSTGHENCLPPALTFSLTSNIASLFFLILNNLMGGGGARCLRNVPASLFLGSLVRGTTTQRREQELGLRKLTPSSKGWLLGEPHPWD